MSLLPKSLQQLPCTWASPGLTRLVWPEGKLQVPLQALRSCQTGAVLFSLCKLPALPPNSRPLTEPRLLLGPLGPLGGLNLWWLHTLLLPGAASVGLSMWDPVPIASESRSWTGHGGVVWRDPGKEPHHWMLGAGEGRQLPLSHQVCRGCQHKPAQLAQIPASPDHHLENLGWPCETLFPSSFLGPAPQTASTSGCPQTQAELGPCPAHPQRISLNPHTLLRKCCQGPRVTSPRAPACERRTRPELSIRPQAYSVSSMLT